MCRTIHHTVERARLLVLAVGLLLCAVPTTQAVRCPTPASVLDSPAFADGQQRLNEEMPSPEQDACYVFWAIDSQGRIGLFVGNNPIGNVDPLGLAFGDWWDLRSYSSGYARLGGEAGIHAQLASHGYDSMKEYQLEHPGYGGTMTSGNLDAVTGAARIAGESATLYVIAATSVTPTASGVKCTTALAERILNAERIGSALKPDATHRLASFVTSEELQKGTSFLFKGGDGVERTLLQTEHVLNGKPGTYEYILDHSGQVTRQRFIPGGKITGAPNQ